MRADLAATVELRDQSRLAAVLRGTDVRTILAGHLHYSTFATFAGIPVSVASATCYTQDLTVPRAAPAGADGAQAYNLVHVYDDTIVHSVVPVDAPDALDTWMPRRRGAAWPTPASPRSAPDCGAIRRRRRIPFCTDLGALPRGAHREQPLQRPGDGHAQLFWDLAPAAVIEAEHVDIPAAREAAPSARGIAAASSGCSCTRGATWAAHDR